ncbi:hypothetical protein LL033_15995 [Clostridium estertheticum]|uniref:hypothetical protein n=1 Tax=Clostridium estertheticum TaxID=238834 RepID=UPI001C0B6F8B|nr:hypothetical protein [Clostridium estertheticum]MBU3215874.1 hypothetical protein [Clostridium estertheticum]WAG54138.1 hypothetical protein LL033_15995 [Clostridium estertheticum]
MLNKKVIVITLGIIFIITFSAFSPNTDTKKDSIYPTEGQWINNDNNNSFTTYIIDLK